MVFARNVIQDIYFGLEYVDYEDVRIKINKGIALHVLLIFITIMGFVFLATETLASFIRMANVFCAKMVSI